MFWSDFETHQTFIVMLKIAIDVLSSIQDVL